MQKRHSELSFFHETINSNEVYPLHETINSNEVYPLRDEGGFRHIFILTEEVWGRAEPKPPVARDQPWRAQCDAAMAERDPVKIAAACERARHAIMARMEELHRLGIHDEQAELEAALRELCLHEYGRSVQVGSGFFDVGLLDS